MAYVETTIEDRDFGKYTGIVCPVSSRSDVDEALKCLIESRKIETYCYAYDITMDRGSDESRSAVGCGLKLLRLLKSLDVRYCLIIIICSEYRKNLHPCERVGRVLKAARETLKKCICNGHNVEQEEGTSK